MVTPRCTCKGLLLEKNMVDGSRIDDLTSSIGGGGVYVIYPLNTSMDLQGDILRVQIIVKCICIYLKREIHVYMKNWMKGVCLFCFF